MATTKQTVQLLGRFLMKGDVVRLSDGVCTITHVSKNLHTKTGAKVSPRSLSSGVVAYVFVKYTYVTDHRSGKTSRVGRPLFADRLYTVFI